MTAQAFLLNCFSLDSGNDGGEQPHLPQHFMEGMLTRCGLQVEWLDEVSWISDQDLPGNDYSSEQGLPVHCWRYQPELDFTMLAAAVHKIACGNAHVLTLVHQSDGAVHGCVLVSPAAAGRFNLLPAAELSTFYVARRKRTGKVTPGEQVMQLLEKAGMEREEIHSVLLAGTYPSNDEDEGDRRIVDSQNKPLLHTLVEKIAGYSGFESEIDVLVNRAGNIIKHLMVLKKL